VRYPRVVPSWLVPCFLVWAAFFAFSHIDLLGARGLSRAWQRTHPFSDDPRSHEPVGLFLIWALELSIWLAPASLWLFGDDLRRFEERTDSFLAWGPAIGFHVAFFVPLAGLAYLLAATLVSGAFELLAPAPIATAVGRILGIGG
jgi:hypothetical protein